MGVIKETGRVCGLFQPGSVGLLCTTCGLMQLLHHISNIPGNCDWVDVCVESPTGDIVIIVKLMPLCVIRLSSATFKKNENRGVHNMVSLPGSLAIYINDKCTSQILRAQTC